MTARRSVDKIALLWDVKGSISGGGQSESWRIIIDHRALPLLLVEDECVIAEMMADVLELGGFGPTRHAATVSQALSAVSAGHWRGAVLDIRLQGEAVFAVAHALRAKGVPFVFSSGGDSRTDIPAEFKSAPVLPKPWSVSDLLKVSEAFFGRANAPSTTEAGML